MDHSILVCEPDKQSILQANEHLQKYLFRERVSYIRAKNNINFWWIH